MFPPNGKLSSQIEAATRHSHDFHSREIREVRKLVEDQFARKLENEHPRLSETEYSPFPCGGHHDSRVQAIVEGVREKSLPINLYCGESTAGFWFGKNLTQWQEFTFDVFKLTDFESGYEFEFQLNGDPSANEELGSIHVLWIRISKNRQGCYWKARTFIKEIIAPLLLEHIGWDSFWGRAIWSKNSEIKNNPSKNKLKDWRWKHAFAGWDAAFKPIVIPGLKLMYLRMGFLPPPLNPDDREIVIYPSRACKERIITTLGDASWDELTKYSFENRFAWSLVQKERAAQIPELQQAQMIADAIDEADESQSRRDENPFCR